MRPPRTAASVRCTRYLPSSSSATTRGSRAKKARPRGADTSGEEEAAAVDALEDRRDARVTGERHGQRAGGLAVLVDRERPLEEPVAQEEERGLGDVGQAVVLDERQLPGVVQALDLAAVDAHLPGQAAEVR